MSLTIKQKEVAVWLVDNTTLTFEQIAEFCNLHPVEVRGIADGEVAANFMGANPVGQKMISLENLEDAQKDKNVALKLLPEFAAYLKSNEKKTSRYTPIARRQDKPDAILWLLKKYPTINDSQISKLIGTTKKTITSIRDKSHSKYQQLKPKDPVLLGLCGQSALNIVAEKLEKAADKESA